MTPPFIYNLILIAIIVVLLFVNAYKGTQVRSLRWKLTTYIQASDSAIEYYTDLACKRGEKIKTLEYQIELLSRSNDSKKKSLPKKREEEL